MGEAALKDNQSSVPVVSSAAASIAARTVTQPSRADLGRADSLRYNVLSYVMDDQYDRAIEQLRAFHEGEKEFELFRIRSERLILHCTDLINAIRAKKKFQNLATLTAAKQKEINEKYMAHFNELMLVLKRVEKMRHDIKLDDSRTTIYVVQSLWISVAALFVLALLLDFQGGLGRTTGLVWDDVTHELARWVSRSLGSGP